MSGNGELKVMPTPTLADDGSIEVHVKFTPPNQFTVVSPKLDIQNTLALLLEVVKANIMAMKQEKPLVEIPGMEIQRRIV